MCTTMEGLWIAVATCVLVLCSVKGHDYPWNYEEDSVFYPEESFKKTWTARKRHPLFQCPDMSPSPSVPTSVEFVKPADIKVVAALGDSITAANGAFAITPLGLHAEFRHVSWSSGGHKTYQDAITLPNIFKLFNPSLIGASSGMSIPFMKTTNSKIAGLNLSVAGAAASDLPKQTQRLIGKLRRHEGLNFEEDWKLLTILIGMNDICDYCKKKAFFSADNYIHFINLSLEMLMDEVPRMIVNVVQIMDMQVLREVTNLSPGCFLQRILCPCMVNPGYNSPQLQEVIGVNMEYQNRLEKHLNSDRFFKKDFAVVLQPFLKHADLPHKPDGKVDMTFFGPDCFHLSVKGHEEMAKGLWNNMFQPVGKKSSHISYPIRLMCPPVEHPYIYTRPQRKSLEYSYK